MDFHIFQAQMTKDNENNWFLKERDVKMDSFRISCLCSGTQQSRHNGSFPASHWIDGEKQSCKKGESALPK